MKPYRGPPITLESAAAAKLRLVVWCKACGHRSEPDPAEQARWYGPETPMPEWRRRDQKRQAEALAAAAVDGIPKLIHNQ